MTDECIRKQVMSEPVPYCLECDEPLPWCIHGILTMKDVHAPLVPERDMYMNPTGKQVCKSCDLWNCWHRKQQPCDIHGCQCERGDNGRIPSSGPSGQGEPAT